MENLPTRVANGEFVLGVDVSKASLACALQGPDRAFVAAEFANDADSQVAEVGKGEGGHGVPAVRRAQRRLRAGPVRDLARARAPGVARRRRAHVQLPPRAQRAQQDGPRRRPRAVRVRAADSVARLGAPLGGAPPAHGPEQVAHPSEGMAPEPEGPRCPPRRRRRRAAQTRCPHQPCRPRHRAAAVHPRRRPGARRHRVRARQRPPLRRRAQVLRPRRHRPATHPVGR